MSGRGRVLIVDDEGGIREICARTLGGMGFEVSSAPNGEAALGRLEAQRFDFVLTDISMPESINGEQLTSEIKHRWPSTDVVIMTAYPGLESAILTLKNGAYDYLIKPFSPELLRAVAARCFEKRSLRAELDQEKLMRRELSAAYAELQKVERLKEAILSRVSHELRTPLFSAGMALETLEARRGNGCQDSELGILKSSLAQLRATIDDLILHAGLSRPDAALKKSPVDLPRIIDGVVERYKALWQERQIQIDVRWENPPKPFCADEGLLAEAFKHLFLNAVHFNKKGGRVSIRGREEARCVLISFEDTGVGISEEALPRVFDAFYQAAEYLTREVGGLGLGLAIVRKIAEAHGGSILVESAPGRGSVFTMRLSAA